MPHKPEEAITYRELKSGGIRFSFVLELEFGFNLLTCFVEFTILTATGTVQPL